MIREIVKKINAHIIPLSYHDVVRGIVYPVLNKTQLIPGERDGSLVYQDAVPDRSKQSIIYWEDWGTTVMYNSPRYSRLQTNVKLIVWMNFEKIIGSYDDCIREIMSKIPRRIDNEVFIVPNGQMHKSPAIFSRYNYREGKQYVAPPFDVAAFDFKIRYMSTYCPTRFNEL
jgi:hypothetical protein